MSESRDIGRYSMGKVEGDKVLGIGTTIEFFQTAGKMSLERDELNISERGMAIEEAVDFSILAEISSASGCICRKAIDEVIHLLGTTKEI